MRQIKAVQRRYLQYNKLGNLVIYTGSIGSGKTLASIVQLVKTKPKKLLSNATLYRLNSKRLSLSFLKDIDEVEKINDCTLLLDMIDCLVDSRSTASNKNKVWSYLFTQLRRRNARVVASMCFLNTLDKRVRYLVTNEIRCEFYRNKYGTLYLYLSQLSKDKRSLNIYPPIRARKYFKYFNTFEIPSRV
jgi:hypothetical protein